MFIHFGLRRFATALGGIVIGLTVIWIALLTFQSITGRNRLLGLLKLFNVGAESSIPTWFSTLLLLFCSALLGVIAVEHALRTDRNPRPWWSLAALFLVLSVDEVAMIHEVVGGKVFGDMIRRWIDRDWTSWSHTWILAYLPLLIVCIVGFLPFFLRLPRRTQIGFVAAASIFVGGGMGAETISLWGRSPGEYGTNFFVFTVIEDFMEMAGASVFVCSLIDYMAITFEGVTIKIGIGRPKPETK
jgi:hypothetical protein